MVTMALAASEESALVARLRDGDEQAFMALVEAYGPLMLRVALGHVRSLAVAEEVVQETWLGVLAGIDRFEGRSSLKTWIVRILVNRAKTRGEREARCVPFSCLEDDAARSVDPSRFLPADHTQGPGHWAIPPQSWAPIPEEQLFSRETLETVARAIRELPRRQQEVILLRDVEGWDGPEVSAALGISEGNQRVLLHRARSKLRAVLEQHLQYVPA
jgi:RNA polymerase sigma-70 factor (ECF subfamily)